MRPVAWSATLLTWCLLSGCKGAGDATGPAGDGPVVFSVSPVDTTEIAFIIALGNLNPPGHTLPSDHIYFYIADPDHCPCDLARKRNVYAVADGRVFTIQHGADDGLYVRASNSISYYYGHLIVTPGIRTNDPVKAGDVVGVTSGLSYGLDLGVIDYRTTQTFISPKRYPDNSLHVGKPLTFFGGSLRSNLYGRVLREGADKDGRINYDQPGALVGNWFLEGLPQDQSSTGPAGWPGQLAFVYDQRQPTRRIVSIGGTIGDPGTFDVATADPAFEQVTPSSGVVTYHLGTGQGFTTLQLLVRMTGASSMLVELFPLSTQTPAFDAQVKTYVR